MRRKGISNKGFERLAGVYKSSQEDGPDWYGEGGETMKTYSVGIGCSPKNDRPKYDTLEQAEEAAMDLAREMAVEEGYDPDTVEIYGDLDTGMGACPENHDGAYYPEILEVD